MSAEGVSPHLVSGTAGSTSEAPSGKAYRGPAMEGSIARWYARTRGSDSQLDDFRRKASALVRTLPPASEVLEVAPGPGYLAIELAKLGARVSALDISRTFVEIVTETAARAGVTVSVRQGDASQMPFPDAAFQLVICQAAFKNFSRPQAAVNEMYRVLRPGGVARIQDMRREASDAGIREEVRSMHLGWFRSAFTRGALRSLRRRAYTVDQFRHFARDSPFGTGTIEVSGIGLELSLLRSDRAESTGAVRRPDRSEGRAELPAANPAKEARRHSSPP